ncbi:Uncharacterized protein Rs2_38506 [Raphanus sativus]|nr:Uncharacterized protein Rs2_38506 [Raphanus sativus]
MEGNHHFIQCCLVARSIGHLIRKNPSIRIFVPHITSLLSLQISISILQLKIDDHEDPQSSIISQYTAHLHHHTSENMTTPDVNPNETDVDGKVKNTDDVHSLPGHTSDDDQVEPVFITTIRHTPLVSEMITDDHNSDDDQDVDPMNHVTEDLPITDDPKSNDDELVTAEKNVTHQSAAYSHSTT